MSAKAELIRKLKRYDDFWKENAEWIIEDLANVAPREAARTFMEIWLGNVRYTKQWKEWTEEDWKQLDELLVTLLEIRFKCHGDELLKEIQAYVDAHDKNILRQIYRKLDELDQH